MENILIANEGNIFAYIDEQGKEILLGSEIYLGINDDGTRYYQVNKESINNDLDRQ